MEIKRHIWQKHMHDVVIDQIAEDYTAKGYTVSKEYKLGKYIADLYVFKGSEHIVVEVKSGKLTPERRKEIVELGAHVRSLGNYKFYVAVANPPKEKKVHIDGIEQLLETELQRHLPAQIKEMVADAVNIHVSDVTIDNLNIQQNKPVHVQGQGIVNFSISRETNSEEQVGEDSLLFEFDLELAYNNEAHLTISSVNKLEVETSGMYD